MKILPCHLFLLRPKKIFTEESAPSRPQRIPVPKLVTLHLIVITINVICSTWHGYRSFVGEGCISLSRMKFIIQTTPHGSFKADCFILDLNKDVICSTWHVYRSFVGEGCCIPLSIG